MTAVTTTPEATTPSVARLLALAMVALLLVDLVGGLWPRSPA